MDKFYGTYRATVSDATDPTASGRLQVSVAAAGVTDVWAEASLPPIPRGLLSLPAVGSTVWVEFEAGDPERPIWTGATWDPTAVDANVTIESPGSLILRAAMVNVEAASTQMTGIVQAQTVIATAGVVSPSYTPGAGNVM